jgi:hypothetical protein
VIEPNVLYVSIPIEEFERLHAEPKQLRVELEQLRDLVGKQQREIQRLRRALSHS